MPKKQLRYQWYETSSAFWVEDTQTGETACMGDGVDMFSTPTGRSIMVATPSFYRALRSMFLHEQQVIGEAYFNR